MKKVYFVCLLSAMFLFATALGVHGIMEKEEKHIKVGFVYVGDEMTPYTANFVNAQEHVQEVFGDQVECVVKYNVAEDQVEGPVLELVEENCDYIIATSYGYSPVVKEIAKQNPEIQFCVPTGDNANADEVLDNYHNCMGTIYQGRYICGVVAGMKIKEMIDEGIITPQQAKIGYVAAFPYSEVVSGYTAFFLGVRSVVPEATMLVKYADTWSSYLLEKKIANELIDEECVVISQHSDTTGPAVACENAGGEIPVYHVGYNQSMTEIAPTRSLISCTIDYTNYFEQSVRAILNGKRIEEEVDADIYGQDAKAGIDRGWIRILDANKAIIAPGTEEAMEDISEALSQKKLEVFYGDYTGTDPFDENDKIDLRTPYIENKTSSAPTFHYVLDDIITILE